MKTEKTIIDQLGEVTQKDIAKFMEVSEPTVSRIIPSIAQFTDFLTALELKVVPESAQCVSAERMASLKYFASIGIQAEQLEDEL